MERIVPPPTGRLASPALRALAESVPEIEHYELDGVPLFHIPSSGATILTLTFGVGRAHEPVIRSGMTHLAEHLILNPINRAFDHSNGITGPLRVTFTTRGSPPEASRFLGEVCEQIAKPRLGRIHEEANVLRSEAATRSPNMSLEVRLQFMRVGYQGLGTVELPELFLRTLDEDVLAEWIANHFVARNAAIWIVGELPHDLYISLEPGSRTPLPAFTAIPGFETPTLVAGDIGGVGASFVVPRGLAIQVAMQTIGQHLRKTLRVDRGLGYVVVADYSPVDADQAVTRVYASCLPAAIPEVQKAVLETIDDVGARGPSDDELADAYEVMVRDMTDPMAFPGRLDRQAANTLMGLDVIPAATILDEMWRLQSDEVASAFRAARETMLLILPNQAQRPNRPFKPYPPPSPDPMGRGSSFELIPTQQRGRFRQPKPPVLFVGNEGLFVESQHRRGVAVRWDDCVAVIHDAWSRTVLGRDGYSFTIDPDRWKDGRQAIALVDRFAPKAVVVPSDRH